MKTNCAGGERLIDDVGEGFGDLDSIFCPLSGDEVDGMADIRGGKLLWMTTSGLLMLRTLFGAKSRDSGGWTPVAAEIEWVDWPASSMVRILFFYAGERDWMMMVVRNKEVCELF